MSVARRAEVPAALQDLNDSTSRATADVGTSLGGVVAAVMHSGQSAVKNAGATVIGSASTAGQGVKTTSSSALSTVSDAVGRARGALGGTVGVVRDKASATTGDGQQRVSALKNRRAQRRIERAADAELPDAVVTQALVENPDVDVDVEGPSVIENTASADVVERVAADDPDRDRADALTRAEEEKEAADEKLEQVKTSRRAKARLVASLVAQSREAIAEEAAARESSTGKKRRGRSALRLALVIAIAGAVAAAVRALRPSSSGTGASIPPKMRPVPDSRPATSTTDAAFGGTDDDTLGTAVQYDTVGAVPSAAGTDPIGRPDTADDLDTAGEMDAEPLFAVVADDTPRADNAPAGVESNGSGSNGSGSHASGSRSVVDSIDDGPDDVFGTIEETSAGTPQQTVLADPPVTDEVGYSSDAPVEDVNENK